ncbi:MAG TPA: hypothetical protein VGV07_16105 [Devosia sp.]|jgi:hypothetical protein|uniref:hypothetical protein n=1 Tax=Devosia sp. TaxID=1871048 RepID=UPI002DDCE457|nr:hypothetical protein [Devosia sp.]HEV2516781.1 hypothetical protein [Devosia sp.]
MDYPRLVAFAAVLTVASTAPAYAYLDPGTASMLLQGLIGGAVAAASVISIYWARLKGFVTRGKATNKKLDDE